MKTSVAIVGYGNLGKEIEKLVANNNNFELVGIFSRRDNVVSEFGTQIIARNKICEYKGKIDLLFLCGGSKSDMLVDAPTLAANFDIINTFDNHSIIFEQTQKIDAIAKLKKHFAIVCAGWDPGLLSIMRTTFFAIGETMPTTLWGKGTSLGHTQAVKEIDGVEDAVAITIPTKNAKKIALCGQNSSKLHKRLVFVCASKHTNKRRIRNKIVHMPHYFENNKTMVRFVSKKGLANHKSFAHKGQVVCQFGKNILQTNISTESNPELTAKIVVCYAKVYKNLKKKYGYGAFVPLDFSALDLTNMTRENAIKTFL